MNIRKTLSLGLILIAGAFGSAAQADHIRAPDIDGYYGEVDEIDIEGTRGFADSDGRKLTLDPITGAYYFEQGGRRYWRDIEDGKVLRLDLDKDGDHERNIDVKLIRGFREVDLDDDRDIEVRRHRSFRDVDLDDDDDDGRMPRWWRRTH